MYFDGWRASSLAFFSYVDWLAKGYTLAWHWDL